MFFPRIVKESNHMTAKNSRRSRFLGFGLMMFIVVLLIAEGARARGFATERRLRVQEIEASHAELYRQLANQAGVLESQRQIYMQRFRGFEALVRQKDGDIFVLRARLAALPRPGDVVTLPDGGK
jgi:hypothetical protein